MIQTIYIKNYIGEETSITLTDSDPDNGFLVKSITGLGPPKATINVSDYAILDGGMYNSARAETRNIVITLLFAKTTKCDSIETARQNSYKYFPLKRKVTLIFETDNRLCETAGYVESNEPDIFSQEESAQISIICDDPYFYEVGDNNPQTTYFGEITSLFEFPFENDSLDENLIEISRYEENKEKVLNYTGDAETGIVIKAHVLNHVGNITIYNFITHEVMKISDEIIGTLTGSKLKASDDLIISTIAGNQYANLLRDGETINVLNAVDRSSDWFQLRKGTNVFAFTTDNDTDNYLEFQIENRVLFEGI